MTPSEAKAQESLQLLPINACTHKTAAALSVQADFLTEQKPDIL